MNVYPDPESGRLRELLADHIDVPRAQILCGAGADELIEIILQLFIEPGDVIINTPPTFAMYGFDAPLYHGRVVDIYRREDFALDLEAIEAAALQHSAKLLFLCSPNNPSGNMIDPASIERLLELPTTIVVDEAYIEFAESESLVKRVGDAPNLIVLRTMSKWAGLAGLRVGYGVFPPKLMPHLWKIKQPYNVNLAADIAAQVLAARCRLPDGPGRTTGRAAQAHGNRIRRVAVPFALSQPSQFCFESRYRHERGNVPRSAVAGGNHRSILQ